MEYPQIQVAVAPTGLILSLQNGDLATFVSLTASVRLNQASEVRRIRRQLILDELESTDAVG